MNQDSISAYADDVMTEGYQLKKSDIVTRVITIRSGIVPSEKKITKDVSSALVQRGLKLEKWDASVDTGLAQRMIKHISSVKGSLSIPQLVQDIDIMVSRWSARVPSRS